MAPHEGEEGSSEGTTAADGAFSLDTFSLICAQMLTPDLLACAPVSSALHALCTQALKQNPAVRLRGPSVSAARLLWLSRDRMGGSCERLDVSDCEHITKASITQA
eukprot:CAMPEP_0119395288 /NCGR_PEP_ID=MMETSP1334-20130426/132756_1 /TAXON_ID=127549 /ORGANISM="Calcidiscus leptoporus, Strain RCC1130" /LENGTH=105 /DNA_ID=CAMNT_0007418745 /DNA_START=8 /DNA_END=321 /DNA_ORIENTATION=+